MRLWQTTVGLLVMVLAILGCGQKEESQTEERKSKVTEAVEWAVTKEFEYYKGAKRSLEKAGKEMEEKREGEKELTQ